MLNALAIDRPCRRRFRRSAASDGGAGREGRRFPRAAAGAHRSRHPDPHPPAESQVAAPAAPRETRVRSPSRTGPQRQHELGSRFTQPGRGRPRHHDLRALRAWDPHTTALAQRALALRRQVRHRHRGACPFAGASPPRTPPARLIRRVAGGGFTPPHPHARDRGLAYFEIDVNDAYITANPRHRPRECSTPTPMAHSRTSSPSSPRPTARSDVMVRIGHRRPRPLILPAWVRCLRRAAAAGAPCTGGDRPKAALRPLGVKDVVLWYRRDRLSAAPCRWRQHATMLGGGRLAAAERSHRGPGTA